MSALQEGDSVMLETSDELITQTRLQPGRKVKLFRQPIAHDALMGLPDGAVVDIAGDKVVQVYDGLLPPMDDLLGEEDEELAAAASNPGHDNSKFVDDNTAQGLSGGEIRMLQNRGVVGADLIRHLASSSATFAQRSRFSKEKWIKTKQRRYMRRVRVVRLTARTMCEYVNHPRVELKGRPWVLRVDALSQILLLSGVTAGSTALVVDDTSGQLCGAMAERMGCQGRLLIGYPGSKGGAADQILRWYNLPAPLDQFALQVPLQELALGMEGEEVAWGPAPPIPHVPLPPRSDTAIGRLAFLPSSLRSRDADFANPPGAQVGGRKRPREEGEAGGAAAPAPSPTAPAPDAAPAAATGAGGEGGVMDTRSLKQARRLGGEHAHGWLKEGVDTLVIAAKHDITSTLLAAIRWVKPGRSFVVFHWDITVLLRAYQVLMAREIARCMNVGEFWTREYQMLPNRTHPAMNMDGASGFVLSGMVVANAYSQCKPEPDAPPAAK